MPCSRVLVTLRPADLTDSREPSRDTHVSLGGARSGWIYLDLFSHLTSLLPPPTLLHSFPTPSPTFCTAPLLCPFSPPSHLPIAPFPRAFAPKEAFVVKAPGGGTCILLEHIPLVPLTAQYPAGGWGGGVGAALSPALGLGTCTQQAHSSSEPASLGWAPADPRIRPAFFLGKWRASFQGLCSQQAPCWFSLLASRLGLDLSAGSSEGSWSTKWLFTIG